MRTTQFWAVLGAAILALGMVTACSDDDSGNPVCGDGVREGSEECDDGNRLSGDGCSSTCMDENAGVCGDGTVDTGEACDDGNTTSGDGCSAICELETDCGNSVREGAEQCDDADFGTNTCLTEGFDGGDLACNTNCTLDTTGCTSTSNCTLTSFATEAASGLTDNVEYYYEEVVTANSLSYLFIVDLYDTGSGMQTGDHTLGVGIEATYMDCAYCVLVSECTDSSCSDTSTTYFATAGTLGLDTLGQVGGSFQGDVTDLVVSEWDMENDVAVTDGDCLDISTWAFDFSPLGQGNW